VPGRYPNVPRGKTWQRGHGFLIRLTSASPANQDLSDDSSSRSIDAAHHTVRRVSQGGREYDGKLSENKNSGRRDVKEHKDLRKQDKAI
jgi:hypothetical protein